MIKVNYHGRLGNMLFEYALGRILAEELGYALEACPIDGFLATYDKVDGDRITSMCTFNGQEIDFDLIQRNKGKMGFLLNGWFQKYEYYKPYKNKIRSWLNRSGFYKHKYKNDAIIHIRRSQSGPIDFKISYYIENNSLFMPNLKNGVYLDPIKLKLDDKIMSHLHQSGLYGNKIMANGDVLSFEWYRDILEGMNFNKLYICTDIPNDPFLDHFKKYNPIISSNDKYKDFDFIRSFNKIIISMSTYSWWAAFLSNAEEIYFPISDYGSWRTGSDIDLKVDDDNRYHFVKAIRENQTFF